jgi:hypothetical protein
MKNHRTHVHKVVIALALLAAAVLPASCGGTSSTTEPTTSTSGTIAPVSTSDATAATTTPTTGPTSATSVPASDTPATTAQGAAISADDAQAVRDLAFKFWAAYNAYEPDTAVSYLDETYRVTKEAVVRDEISRIETFGVTLGMSEKTAPALTGPDQAEMYLSMKEPIGTRTMLMKFDKQGGAWIITYSEEVK